MKDWDAIYKAKGAFQKDPSTMVMNAIDHWEEIGVKRILDLGCGTGRHTTVLVDRGFETYGCDSSEEALAIAPDIIGKDRFAHCDMTSLPYEDEFFDGILCNHVIQHGMFAEAQKAINEMFRILKKAGHLFLVVVSTEHPKYFTGREIEPNTKIDTDAVDGNIPHHFFTKEELHSLCSPFNILKLDHVKGPSELDSQKESAAWILYAQKPK